ncbi:MAG TPA: SOS response-associated peptidase [Candidatus Marinimicrobia bacterium]|nr:SOS response-associated peptidase [Candidatus Neomarinimicrobiota bacterium]
MCGRKTLTKGKLEIMESLFADEWEGEDFQPSWNVAPTQQHPVLIRRNNKRIIKMMRWGLIPSWAKDEKLAASMINARSESLTKKAAFRDLIHHHRCLIIMDGYYEWKTDSSGKQAFYIYLENSSLLLAAGLWSQWQNQISYTIITTEAKGKLTEIHHRMPLLLDYSEQERWLSPEFSYHENRKSLQSACNELVFHPVSSAVNKIINNYPELILEKDEKQAHQQLKLF